MTKKNKATGKRFQTWFGVTLPPWKEEKYGAGSTTIRFVLSGRIPSKKNNNQAVAVRKKAVDWAKEQQSTGRAATWGDVYTAIGMVYAKVIGNKEYKAFVLKVKPILQEQSGWWANKLRRKGLTFPIPKSTMTLRLYHKDRYIVDAVNKQQTIQDVLVEAGIIVDDDTRNFNPVKAAAASYYEEIIDNIAFISLTFNIRHPPCV